MRSDVAIGQRSRSQVQRVQTEHLTRTATTEPACVRKGSVKGLQGGGKETAEKDGKRTVTSQEEEEEEEEGRSLPHPLTWRAPLL